jgi:hypothetical protein
LVSHIHFIGVDVVMRSLILSILITLFASDACFAQGMFGERTLGRSSISRRTQPGATAASDVPGSLGSGQRFLREERDVTDFVGSAAAAGSAAGFVGGLSAVNAAVSSVTGLTEEVRPPLNRPRLVRPGRLYPERLTLPDELMITATEFTDTPQLSSALQTLIQSRGVSIEVSGADRSATLHGVVPSEHDRRTTELLVMLEPGIQTVVNRLQVNPSLPPIRNVRPNRSAQ